MHDSEFDRQRSPYGQRVSKSEQRPRYGRSQGLERDHSLEDRSYADVDAAAHCAQHVRSESGFLLECGARHRSAITPGASGIADLAAYCRGLGLDLLPTFSSDAYFSRGAAFATAANQRRRATEV